LGFCFSTFVFYGVSGSVHCLQTLQAASIGLSVFLPLKNNLSLVLPRFAVLHFTFQSGDLGGLGHLLFPIVCALEMVRGFRLGLWWDVADGVRYHHQFGWENLLNFLLGLFFTLHFIPLLF